MPRSRHTLGMTNILHASDAAELLGIVPALAGYTPTRSLVLLPFHGKRAHGAMRIDLPRDGIELDEYVDLVLHCLRQVRGADAVAVVAYSDDEPLPTPEGVVLPHAAMVDALLVEAHEGGYRIVEALCLTPSGWADYLDDVPQLHPLDRVRAATPPGTEIAADQHAGVELPPSNLVRRERVGRALIDLERVLERWLCGVPGPGPDENPQALAAAIELDDVPGFAECLVDGGDLEPFETAALLWCLARPMLRDAILVQWAGGIELGRQAFEAWTGHPEPGEEVPARVGEVFAGAGGRPDPDRLHRALAVVKQAASDAPRAARPGALVSCAWLSWALGRSTHAGEYLRLAREIDPGHRLAGLLLAMLDAAMMPEWVLDQLPAEDGVRTTHII